MITYYPSHKVQIIEFLIRILAGHFGLGNCMPPTELGPSLYPITIEDHKRMMRRHERVLPCRNPANNISGLIDRAIVLAARRLYTRRDGELDYIFYVT